MCAYRECEWEAQARERLAKAVVEWPEKLKVVDGVLVRDKVRLPAHGRGGICEALRGQHVCVSQVVDVDPLH